MRSKPILGVVALGLAIWGGVQARQAYFRHELADFSSRGRFALASRVVDEHVEAFVGSFEACRMALAACLESRAAREARLLFDLCLENRVVPPEEVDRGHALIEESEGDYERAAATMARAMTRFPNAVSIARTRLRILLSHRLPAREAFGMALQRFPNDPEVAELGLEYYLASDMKSEASQLLARIRMTNMPDSPRLSAAIDRALATPGVSAGGAASPTQVTAQSPAPGVTASAEWNGPAWAKRDMQPPLPAGAGVTIVKSAHPAPADIGFSGTAGTHWSNHPPTHQ